MQQPPTVLEPISSAEVPAIDPGQLEEIERRHELLIEYMALNNLQGLLLQKPHNFAWLTLGGNNSRLGSERTTAALFITPEARVVLCHSADSGQIFDHELGGLGFQLKERSWTEPREILYRDLCRGRQVATDLDFTQSLDRDLAGLRSVLSPEEQTRLRSLSRELTHCVEATARNCQPGETEAEIAAQVSHRLLKRGIIPDTIQVIADEQGRRYRHWSFSQNRIHRAVTISVVACHRGLHAGISRTVCFHSPPQELLDWHQLASLIQATGIFFSQTGWVESEVWQRIARIYEKFGEPDEWRAAEQADLIGYAACERTLTPKSTSTLVEGQALYWHPSIRAAVTGDTILLTPEGAEILTRSELWPSQTVSVKGRLFQQPTILCRECPNGSGAGVTDLS